MSSGNWPPVAELLPHGPEACCLESVLEFVPGERLAAGMHVRPGLVLYNEACGGIPAWAGIEIMAQGAGLYLGLSTYLRGDAAAAVGYLVGVRGFRAKRPAYAAGMDLHVEAVCLSAWGEGLGRFQCRIVGDGEELADATLMVWRADYGKGEA